MEQTRKARLRLGAVVGLGAALALIASACSGSSDPTATRAPSQPSPTASRPQPTQTATALPAVATLTATPAPAPTATPPAPAATATPRPTRTPTATLEPTPVVSLTTDVSFVAPLQDGLTAWKLDVYAPLTSGDWPSVVLLPGASATKESPEFQALARDIADRGAVVFLVNFPGGDGRQYFRTPNGSGLRDIYEIGACAIRFARAEAQAYGGGRGPVVVLGQSAGGVVGLWATLVGDDGDEVWDDFAATRGGPPKQQDCTGGAASAVPDAFVGYAGGYNVFDLVMDEDAELHELVSPGSHVGRNAQVLMRFMVGSSDTVVPSFLQERHEELYEAMVESGYDATWTTIDAGHFVTSASHGPIVEAVTDVIDVLPAASSAELVYDPAGPDRNCDDFQAWQQAQDFFIAAGGPGMDPHGLDQDGDGTACESLPGAP